MAKLHSRSCIWGGKFVSICYRSEQVSGEGGGTVLSLFLQSGCGLTEVGNLICQAEVQQRFVRFLVVT